ncbi:hypothetical protein TTHT_0791 [Thermotomaculum hydrothermale]|uniref:Uncharacterized protein n=1 Tax=Thermotomaculum hydrothermale TaxID=981385 RepID=A0A7R6SZ40_9BACT|nr:hypothetical protein [Thermotomaculum hydrothermale]BBB32357.1 hypothetical protein TTHT_0791 [Thermotomaculum hydrothermale]
MSFFKKIVSKIKNSIPAQIEEKEEVQIKKEILDIDDFWKEFNLIKLESSPEETYNKIKELVLNLNHDLKKQLHRIIRTRLYGIEVEESENREFVKNFVNFRIKLYNPVYKKTQDIRLGKLILTVLSRYPDAIKNKKISETNTSIFNKDDIEIQKLSSELINMYKLTPSEVEQTIQKIIEYNKQNVKFTDEEETVLTNSELLRNLLESITFLLQEFVEKCSNWKKYFLKTFLFDDPALIKILNFDKNLLFGDKFQGSDFVELILTKNVKGELEPLVSEPLKPLLKKDVSAIINRLKLKLINEEIEFIKDITTSIAGNIVLLHQYNELPSFKILDSLLTKSFKFHRKYFPDLMDIVDVIKNKILNTIGKDYQEFWKFTEIYQNEINDFIYSYSKENFKITVDYPKFIELLKEKPQEKKLDFTYSASRELLPEELKFISDNLDVEPAIMELNDKIRAAEKNIPIFEDEYFYPSKKDYIKTALLETLNTLLNTRQKPELIHSVLMKTIDLSEGESSKIALDLLSSMKIEGIKPQIVSSLLKKQKNKNHITNKIKSLLIEEDDFFYNNQENLKIELQKYSKITGIGFFIATVNNNETYKITAHFKEGKWKITHYGQISEYNF